MGKYSRDPQRLAILPIMVWLIVLWGCAPAIVSTDIKIGADPSSVRKIPLKAGLLFSEQFRKAAFVGNKGGRETPIAIGDSLVEGAKQAVGMAFSDVVVLESTGAGNAGDIAVIVTPEIVTLENVLVGFPPVSKWNTRVSCKWTIKTFQGEQKYLNTIVGEGHYEAFTTGFTYGTRLAESMVPAIQDHYKKLLVDITTRPWWETRSSRKPAMTKKPAGAATVLVVSRNRGFR